MKIHKYVGLDVHKEKTTVAIAEGDRHGEGEPRGQPADCYSKRAG
jgi:hypothetical protein